MKTLSKYYYPLVVALLGLSLASCDKQAEPEPSAALQTQVTANASGEPALTTNQTLTAGQYLQSVNGQYRLLMESNGNLLLYRVSDVQTLWVSNTYGNPGARLVVQSDGSIVIYSSTNAVLWIANGTTGAGGYAWDLLWERVRKPGTGYQLEVTDNGSLILYDLTPTIGLTGARWVRRLIIH